MHMQHIEESGGDSIHVECLRRISSFAYDGLFSGGRFYGFEGGGLLAIFEKVGVGGAYSVAVLGELLIADRYQSFAAGKRHGFEQRGVHQREDHGVEANAQRQSRHHGGRKPAMGRYHAQGESQVMGHTRGIRRGRPHCSGDGNNFPGMSRQHGLPVFSGY